MGSIKQVNSDGYSPPTILPREKLNIPTYEWTMIIGQGSIK